METIEIKRNKYSFVTTERKMNIVSSSLMRSLIKTKARLSLQFCDDETSISKSIISTAEQHLRSQINLQQILIDSNPKLTSSTITLLNQEKEDTKSLTFNVDFASTPKKVIQRSSTPIRLNPIKIKSNQFKSSVVKQAKMFSKFLSPPLLTSSFQDQRKEKKRKNCSSQCKNIKQNKRAKIISNAITSTPSFKHLKYPIKYLKSKTKDIDRLNFQFEQKSNDLHCCSHQSELLNFLKPNLSKQSGNCYLYGEYKMWIV